jgi:glucose/arabinose dehydrogenase/mono/diheme cytochrome c family protein
MKRITIVVASVLVFGLFAWPGQGREAGSAHKTKPNTTSAQSPDRQTDLEPERHFSPQVESFVKDFKGVGEGVEGARDAKVLSPEESIKRFKVGDGLEIEPVASEPVIRQPLNMHFDERGRLWVVQYLQYPFPAGLKVVKYDRYLRAVFDKVPNPPPHHDKGADKITILEDTDGDGQFESHKDFLTGLNIATSVAVGRGGVWVLNPPYLLFYPDRNKDDVPDGDPEVCLSGFGLEDTHAVANNLHWGPDGWLYGVQGSTTTANVKGIHFLGQAVWRYHPASKAFELFAEGGGNPWTLDFDSKGRVFVGTNVGAARGLHIVQGGCYVKNWPKHGPLTNPYAFGFFQHMAHSGYRPRFSQTLVIYEGGALPKYEGQMIAGMALTNRVQASRLLQDSSSFKTVDTDALVQTDNRWFRPVDTRVGPEGAVYLADWHDIRLTHLSPVDNWDKAHGRIYRLKAEGTQPIKPFDLSKLTNEQLIGVLSHKNRWFREEAQRIFADRRDKTIVPALKELVETTRGQLALEALWAVNLSGGFDDTFALRQLGHHDEFVRYWTVRLLGDSNNVSPPIQARLIELARTETQVEVRSQLASSCKRLPARSAFPIIRELMVRGEDVDDLHIPLLLWWAIESKATPDRDSLLTMLKDKTLWESPLFNRHIVSRLARRYTAERGDKSSYTLNDAVYSDWQTNHTSQRTNENLTSCAHLLNLAPNTQGVHEVIKGMDEGLGGTILRSVPGGLRRQISKLLAAQPADPGLISLALRLGNREVTDSALRLVGDSSTSGPDRKRLLASLVDGKEASVVPVLLGQLRKAESDDLKIEALGALRHFSNPEIAQTILQVYPGMDPHIGGVAQECLSSRSTWARMLLEAVDQGSIKPEQITEDRLLAIQKYGDPKSLALIEKHWGNLENRTHANEEQPRSFKEGEKHYASRCGYCHLASGDGMQKSLVNSKWVLGPEQALIRIVLQGKETGGEIMPPFAGEFNDQQIASILTYIRRKWGHQAQPIRAETVGEVRQSIAARNKPWTEAELAQFLQ